MQWQLISRPLHHARPTDCRRTKLALDDDFMEAECVDDVLLLP